MKEAGSEAVLDGVERVTGHRFPQTILAENPVPQSVGDVRVDQEKQKIRNAYVEANRASEQGIVGPDPAAGAENVRFGCELGDQKAGGEYSSQRAVDGDLRNPSGGSFPSRRIGGQARASAE